MNLKRKIIVLFAVLMVAFSVSPFVLAATPAPADNMASQQQTDTAAATIMPNAAGGAAYPTANTTTETVNKKYLTKGAAVFWFIFTFILNAVLSFWIGNRFYRMSKKDNHLTSEIRALRRDVESKFLNNVGGFAEQEIDINNLNESLAADDGLKTAKKQSVIREVSEEEEERFRQWEEAQSKSSSHRPRPKSAVKEELQEDLEDVKRIKRKNYQPKRVPTADTDIDDGDDLGQTREVKLKGDNVKSKAKEILSDIFPFKED